MNKGYGKVYTTRIQKPHFSGLGVYDPNKVFTKADENGKVFVDDVLSCICKAYEVDNNSVIIDGKTYKTVKIDNQTWLAENLDMIVGTFGAEGLPTEAACWYYNNEDDGSGLLYNGYAAVEIDIPGWHVATKEDWETLFTNVGGTSVASKKLRDETFGGTNNYDFSIIAAGGRNTSGIFVSKGTYGRFWTSTETADKLNNFYFGFTTADSIITNNLAKSAGYSIRLVKD